MQTKHSFLVLALALTVRAAAQSPGPPPGEPGAMSMGPPGKHIVIRQEMGKWWQDSDMAKKLQLSDSQIKQLDQIFFDHRLKLIDYGAAMEKEDLKLQNLLDADVPNESQVGSQVDQVLAARGKLEREYTMMNLDLRKVLSVEQWRQLKSIRDERKPPEHNFFYRQLPPGMGPHGGPPPPGPEGSQPF